MKIIFIYPQLGDGQTRHPNSRRYFPWGVATVMQCLEDDGHEVSVLDAYGNDLLPSEVVAHLDKQSFDVACISGFASYNFGYASWLAEELKMRKNVPVVVGGILADLHWDLLLRNGNIDFAVIGEGEETCVELLQNLGDPSNVAGIAYRANGEIKCTPPRDPIKNLDSLPMPNFALWNMEPYLRGSLIANDLSTRYEEYSANLPSFEELHPNMSIFFGRGCPYQCRFCSRSYKRVRYKSTERVISEIKTLIDKFGVKAVHFQDELVVFERRRVLDLCEAIKPLGVYWDCQARVNTIDRELIHAMKGANCYSLGFGFETGSSKLLKAMGKGVTREQNIEVLRLAEELGMHLKIQLMCGYPGETRETMAETVSMMKESSLPPRDMNWATPLPGSELYEYAKSLGIIGDEETYLRLLGQKNMNMPGNVVANVSGLSNKEMTKLYKWAHIKMDWNFALKRLRAKPNPFDKGFWETIYWLVRRRLSRVQIALKIYQAIFNAKAKGSK